jgi:hypothetical protein
MENNEPVKPDEGLLLNEDSLEIIPILKTYENSGFTDGFTNLVNGLLQAQLIECQTAFAVERAAMLKANAGQQKQVKELKAEYDEGVLEIGRLNKNNMEVAVEIAVEPLEFRIKELERINRVLEQQLTLENKPIAEAKAEAYKEVADKVEGIENPFAGGESGKMCAGFSEGLQAVKKILGKV